MGVAAVVRSVRVTVGFPTADVLHDEDHRCCAARVAIRMLKVRVAEVDGCEKCGDKLGHLPVLDHDDRGNPVYGKHKLTLSSHRWASRVPGRKEHKNRGGFPVLADVVRNDLCAVLCCDCDRATHI